MEFHGIQSFVSHTLLTTFKITYPTIESRIVGLIVGCHGVCLVFGVLFFSKWQNSLQHTIFVFLDYINKKLSRRWRISQTICVCVSMIQIEKKKIHSQAIQFKYYYFVSATLFSILLLDLILFSAGFCFVKVQLFIIWWLFHFACIHFAHTRTGLIRCNRIFHRLCRTCFEKAATAREREKKKVTPWDVCRKTHNEIQRHNT